MIPEPRHATSAHDAPRHASPPRFAHWPRILVGGLVAAVLLVLLVATSPGLAGLPGLPGEPPPADPTTALAVREPTSTPTSTPSPETRTSPTRSPTPTVTAEASSRNRTPTPAATRPKPTRPAAPTEQATKKPARPAVATPGTASSWEQRQAAEVLRLVNEQRSAAGCSDLRNDGAIARASRGHSADMAENGYFDHTSQDGRSPFDRMRAAGYADGSGENIAAGQPDAAAVVASWMDSPGHRANILSCENKASGVGVVRGGSYGTYWTHGFGRR